MRSDHPVPQKPEREGSRQEGEFEVVATAEDVTEAIESLTTAELLKLEKYARYRIRGLGRRAAGRDHGDLLREAITATLSGNRRWKRETVDFFTHLVGVMRSLSSHWREGYHPDEALLESELSEPGEESRSPLSLKASDAPNAERLLSARQQVEAIEKKFSADPTVPLILEGLKQGMTGPEIQHASGLSKTEYETGLRRLRRGVASMAKGESL